MLLSELVENPDNPSVATDEEIKRLKGKLERVPKGLTAMRIAYVTDKIEGKKMVISGNKRLRVLKEQFGEDAELPDEYFQDVTSMSEAERHEFIVTANISDGHWDAKKLLEQYDTSELSELMESAAIDQLIRKTGPARARGKGVSSNEQLDEANAKSKFGTVYQLGNHRLLVGDSTKQEDYAKLMDGKEADLLLTDPPYGVNIVGNAEGKNLGIANDNLQGDEFQKFLDDFATGAFKSLKKGGAFYIWHGDGGVEAPFHKMLEKQDVHHITAIYWVKNQMTFSMGRLDYNKMCEHAEYGWKNGGGHYFAKDSKLTTILQDDYPDTSKMSKEQLKEIVDQILSNSNICYFNKPSRSALHPTMKPVELFQKLVSNSSRIGEIVLDPFAGSGTAFIACEDLDRICYGIEYLPYYADVIRKRWAEYVHGEGCDWEALTPEVDGGIQTL